MDFSLHDVSRTAVPSSSTSPSLEATTVVGVVPSSVLEYLTHHDLDLLSSSLPFSSDMVPQTIEPSQLTDHAYSSDSPSPSPDPLSSDPASPASSVSSVTSPVYKHDDSFAVRHRTSRTNKRRAPAHQSDDDNSHSERHAKRHQTKLACTWCRKLSKKCDSQRPCGRCMQFNRCAECVDAPPRKPRARGVDRGMYKKTRDLAAKDYSAAVARRGAYVTKQGKKGRVISLGLTEDSPRGDDRDTQMKEPAMDHVDGHLPCGGDTTLQGVSSPFTGPLEDLFTGSEDLVLSSPDIFSSINSPAESSVLFDLFPTDSTSPEVKYERDLSPLPQYDPSSWQWQSLDHLSNIKQLLATGVEAAEQEHMQDGWNSWLDSALVA
jgi:Fungal Zn(2)-Cys(6) binuclear cluster domain